MSAERNGHPEIPGSAAGGGGAPGFRAFIAIELPEEVRACIVRLQELLRGQGLAQKLGRGARLVWVKPEALHLTLRFLDTISEEKAALVTKAMEQAALMEAPFEIRVGSLGGAPKLSSPRVLWLDLLDGKAACRLEKALSEQLRGIGIAPEERPFQPHITLARVKWNGRPRSVSHDVTRILQGDFQAEGADAEKGVEAAPTFVVYTYSLIESRLTPDGPRYQRRVSVPLGGHKAGPTGS